MKKATDMRIMANNRHKEMETERKLKTKKWLDEIVTPKIEEKAKQGCYNLEISLQMFFRLKDVEKILVEYGYTVIKNTYGNIIISW